MFPQMFQALHTCKIRAVLYINALVSWNQAPPVDRRAPRLNGSPDFVTAVVHMQAVNVTVLQQLLVPVQRKEWRQMQYVACALRSLRHLILDIASAGSVFLGCIAETWTHYYAELNNYTHFPLSLGFN